MNLKAREITKMTPEIAATITAGRWVNGMPEEFGSINFDSRKFNKGEIFIALTAQRDGHAYVTDAHEMGASAAIVRHQLDVPVPQLVVDDPERALYDLAHWWRAMYRGQLVLVTGSNGKSTTKEMIYEICKSYVGEKRCMASQHNFNNLIGMPLSLLRINLEHEFSVVEAGMSNPGEIYRLARIARPTMGVITNAGHAHLANFSNEEGIARAKGELIEVMTPNHPVVLNSDDKFFPLWRSMASHLEVLSFSHSGDSRSVCRRIPGREFMFSFDGSASIHEVDLQVAGAHNEENSLAAALVAWRLGVPPDSIDAGLENFSGVRGRQELLMRPGIVVIDDSYNASPESCSVAINELAARPERNKVLVLGDMLELGEDSLHFHEEVLHKARKAGISKVLAFGECYTAATGKAGGDAFARKEDLIAAARSAAKTDCVVLVKGSRSLHLEEVVQALIEAV